MLFALWRVGKRKKVDKRDSTKEIDKGKSFFSVKLSADDDLKWTGFELKLGKIATVADKRDAG